MKKIIILSAILASFISCQKQDRTDQSGFEDDSMWCRKPTKATEVADVFYIVSTNIMKSYKPDGTETYIAVLNDEEKSLLAKEINYIHESMFPEKVNFYAPYYHQATMASVADSTLTYEDRKQLSEKVAEEVMDAFNYYFKNFNEGRPFILAGYSQGAVQAGIILTKMTQDQIKHMVAAYLMGFGINEKILASPNVKPATGATDTGVAISFTSLANLEAKYDLLNNSEVCINPVNWHTDSTSVKFVYDDETLTAHVNEEHHVVLVDGFHYEKHKPQEWSINPWSKDNYHNFEIYFYASSIRQNALDRIDAMVN